MGKRNTKLFFFSFVVIVGLWGTHAYEKHAQRSPSMPSITREPRGLISNHAPLRCCFASFQNNPLKRLHLKRALADTPLGSDRTNPISSQLLKLAFTLELCRLANNATPHQCPTTPSPPTPPPPPPLLFLSLWLPNLPSWQPVCQPGRASGWVGGG